MKPLGKSFRYGELNTFLGELVDSKQTSEEIEKFLTGTQLVNRVAVRNYPDINTKASDGGKT